MSLLLSALIRGHKRPEKGQQVEWQMSGWLGKAKAKRGFCPSPLTWQQAASGLLAPELNWRGGGGGRVPGPLEDGLGSILQLLVTRVLISLKSPLLYVP